MLKNYFIYPLINTSLPDPYQSSTHLKYGPDSQKCGVYDTFFLSLTPSRLMKQNKVADSIPYHLIISLRLLL